METLYIADDEANIREGLKLILDWEDLGFTICGEAGNGEDALSDILRLNPSLVFLDIRMPRMYGIDVAKAAREQGYKGRFIILSGYSDFTYAQKAINYGVDNYLTKPIDEDELLEAVLQVKKIIEKEKSSSTSIEQYKKKAKNVILSDLILGNMDMGQMDTSGMNLDASVYQVLIYENFNREITDIYYHFSDLLRVSHSKNDIFEYLHENGHDIILLKGELALYKFERFLSHYENTPQKGSPLDSLFIVYGHPVDDLFSIHTSYAEASTLILRRFFCIQGQHTLGFEELPDLAKKNLEITSKKLQEYSEQLIGYIQSFNRKKTAEALFSLENYLYNVVNDIKDVKLFLTDLYLQIKEKINHVYNTCEIPFPSNSSIIDIITKKYYLYEIIQFFSEQFEMIMNTIGNTSRDSVLDDILYYIDHNFKNNIKLETIAPLFGYNSAYLGKIFSKTFNESFNSYVDNRRIEYSKELLLENRLKVYEIAEQVGYKNVDYFHKKFKKYVGESPAEFRKKMGVGSDEV